MLNIDTNNTNSVQTFIRTLAWIVSMLFFGLILILPLVSVSSNLFETGAILGIPSLLLSVWISGIISKMFFILPEWEKMVILRLGKFDGVRGAGFFIIPPFIYSV